MSLRRLTRISFLAPHSLFRPFVHQRWYLEEPQLERPTNLEKSMEEQKEALRILTDISKELKDDLKTTKFIAELAFAMGFASFGFLVIVSGA